MTDHRATGGNKNRIWIVAALVVLALGLLVYFVGGNQTDDNLVPSATAIDPRSGNLTATGTAAESATGVEIGAAAPPPLGGVAPGAAGDAALGGDTPSGGNAAGAGTPAAPPPSPAPAPQ